jgi:hypothetical protein
MKTLKLSRKYAKERRDCIVSLIVNKRQKVIAYVHKDGFKVVVSRNLGDAFDIELPDAPRITELQYEKEVSHVPKKA